MTGADKTQALFGFSANPDVAYKFKAADGKWTQLLTFVRVKENSATVMHVAVFKPETDRLSTLKELVIQVFIGPVDLSQYRVFNMCKFYGTWERAPHVCGADCPLGR